MTLQALEFFATDSALEGLESALLAARSAEQRLPALLALAWQLRQRDTARALALAAEAETLLAEGSGQQAGPAIRVRLIRAEAKCLSGALVEAMAMAEAAQRDAALAADTLACADAHGLSAWIADGLGDATRRDQELQAMAGSAGLAGEPLRVGFAQAWMARFDTFGDVAAAKQRWSDLLAEPGPELHPALRAARHFFLALAAHFSGEHVAAIRHSGAGFDLALQTGQLRNAVVCACNLAEDLNDLNDHQQALDWAQRALDLARPRAWPEVMASALGIAAETLRLLRRFELAGELMAEALSMLPADGGQFSMVLASLGEVELDRRRYPEALAVFRQMEPKARSLGEEQLIFRSLLGQAKALLQLDQAEAALAMAESALAEAKTRAAWQLRSLQVLGEIHARHPGLPVPACMSAANAALHYLELALHLASSIENYSVSGGLLEALAQQYAELGELGQAFDYSKQAIRAYANSHSVESSRRAIAMQVGHEAESARLEAAQQRHVAQAHAQRAATLEQANATLEQLGAIGRDITGNLEATAIIAALDRHVHALLDAFAFTIYRMGMDGETVTMLFGVEDGLPLAPFTGKLRPQGPGERCMRERREIVLNVQAGEGGLMPGTTETLSQMYAPLLVGERVLGIMSIQSPRPQAYGEREVAIFQTLCAYGAIALANAEAQAQLIQSEKMASLGQLVANVAHEINTPIGAIKSSGATIVESLSETLAGLPPLLQALDPHIQLLFSELIGQASRASPLLSSREERAVVKSLSEALQQAGLEDARALAQLLVQLGLTTLPESLLPLLRDPLRERILQAVQGVSTVVRGASNINTAVERVAKIVFALKSYSRVDKSGEMRPTDLVESIETVLTIYQHQLKQGTELIRRYEADLPLLPCLPDELNQVWTNLIHNALQAMQHRGVLTITIERAGDAELRVSVGDSGCGIPVGIRGRIFDPFFTTKPVGEGSGLGLDIVKKIVEKHRGRIELQSEVGVGTLFSVSLPYEA